MLAANLDRQRFRLQPVAAAGLATALILEPLQLFAHPRGIRFAVTPFQIWQHAFEYFFGFIPAQSIVINECNHIFARALQHHIACLFRQVFPGNGHRELVVLGQGLQRLAVKG